MLRFQQLITEIKESNPQGSAMNPSQIDELVSQCGHEDAADIVGWMDHLAAEKASLPQWDGDSSDDISQAQYNLACVLLGLREKLGPEVETVLTGAGEDTRTWLKVAEEMKSLDESSGQK